MRLCALCGEAQTIKHVLEQCRVTGESNMRMRWRRDSFDLEEFSEMELHCNRLLDMHLGVNTGIIDRFGAHAFARNSKPPVNNID